MTTLSAVALVTSFAAGIVSFLSPCVLPLVPGYLSYIAGQPAESSVRASHRIDAAALRLGFLFVLGFSTVFVVLGASATALGRLLLSYREAENIVAGAVVIVFGVLMMGLVRWPWLQREFRMHPDLPGGRPAAAYVLGLAFAFGWTPCIGSVLGAILTASAATATVAQGIVLLTAYSLGLGIPFLAAAVCMDRLSDRLRRLRRPGRVLQADTGGVVIAMGLAMITGQLTAFPTGCSTPSRSWRGSDDDTDATPFHPRDKDPHDVEFLQDHRRRCAADDRVRLGVGHLRRRSGQSAARLARPSRNDGQ